MQNFEKWSATVELTNEQLDYLKSAPPDSLYFNDGSYKSLTEYDQILPEINFEIFRNFHGILCQEYWFLNKDNQQIQSSNTDSYNLSTRVYEEFR